MNELLRKLKRKNNVTVTDDIENNCTYVRYYTTDIVRFDYYHIILDTGGHMTRSTKDHMNLVSDVYNLNYRVYKRDDRFHVMYRREILPFNDRGSIILNRPAYVRKNEEAT